MRNKKLDKEIEQAYYKLAQGKQISVLDIPKVFDEATRAVTKRGSTVEQAVRAAILMYCMEAA